MTDIKKQYAGSRSQNKFLREANEALSAEVRRLQSELAAANKMIAALRENAEHQGRYIGEKLEDLAAAREEVTAADTEWRKLANVLRVVSARAEAAEAKLARL